MHLRNWKMHQLCSECLQWLVYRWHTVDGRNPASPLQNPVNKRDKLPTSTGERRISEPSTVWPSFDHRKSCFPEFKYMDDENSDPVVAACLGFRKEARNKKKWERSYTRFLIINWRLSRWWFQRFFILTPIWGGFPFWLIFFRWVETTNRERSYARFLIIIWRLPSRELKKSPPFKWHFESMIFLFPRWDIDMLIPWRVYFFQGYFTKNPSHWPQILGRLWLVNVCFLLIHLRYGCFRKWGTPKKDDL